MSTSPDPPDPPAFPVSAPERPRAGRTMVAVVVLMVVAASLLLVVAGQPWAYRSGSGGPGLPSVSATVTGRSVAPALVGIGLLGLAAVAGVLATRGWTRRLVGVVMLVAGAGVVLAGIDGVRAPAGAAPARHLAATVDAMTVRGTGWPWVAVLAGVLLAASGVLVAILGPRWPGMGGRPGEPGRYSRPGTMRSRPGASGSGASGSASPAPGRLGPVALWDSLDRGEDPTDTSADPLPE
ncbi:MAG: Trp biosynthesis-associated membrane protein [Actinomycetes bacterium]